MPEGAGGESSQESEPFSPPSPAPFYKRLILKLSGESFTHGGERGISMEEVLQIARQIQQARALGCEFILNMQLHFHFPSRPSCHRPVRRRNLRPILK